MLEAVAYIQTRWHQVTYTETELVNRPSDMQPPAFGVMGLRDDNWFGRSLDSAAKMIGLPPDSLRNDAYQNIRGAAALLAKYRNEANKDSVTVTSDLSSWSRVIARFSGIPQEEIALQFAYHTLQYLQIGVNENGIVIPAQKINLDNFPESVKAKGFKAKKNPLPNGPNRTMGVNGGGSDYPGAVWDPSQNFGSRNGAPIVFVIIHDTEGSFDASVSWLQNPAAQASSHYIIRSQDGYIEQLVHEADEAWAVRCWNPITISIEHEGYVSTPAYFTEVMYESSAHLTQYLCDKYKIAEDSLHVFGHDAWTYSWFNLIPFSQYTQYVGTSYATCNDHTDPGQYWNWHHYFDLIHSYDTTKAFAVSSTPAAGDTGVPAYSSVTVNFNAPMDSSSVNSAFSITPNVAGQLSFNSNGTQLVFSHPASLLAWSTTYAVRIDTSAKASNGRAIAVPYTFQFTTVPIDTSGPSVIAASPQNGGTSVIKAYFEFVLNEPVEYNSFPSRITFVDSTGKKVAFTKDMFQVTSNNLTLIALRSSFSLTPGMKYTAALEPGLADYYGNLSKATYAVAFTVDTSEASGGSVIDGFETSSGQWLQPSASPQTFGVDTTSSSFGLAYRSYDGNDAGCMEYQFDSTQAVCAVENSRGYDVRGAYSVGMWVFGDNSRNELDFIFGSSPERLVPVDTINWYGWKYVGMWRDKSDVSTSTFKGFATESLTLALLSTGTLYVDDVQVNGKITGVFGTVAGPPTSLELYQNYPNPFNPTTVISYQLSAVSYVTLKVYDVLGREVATVVNEHQNPGSHTVAFDASKLSSGVYFYRLNAGTYTATKKMMVVK